MIPALTPNYNRANRESLAIRRIVKVCPLEQRLRQKRVDDARLLLELAQQCYAEVKHCYALRVAGFQPGDHVLVTWRHPDFPQEPRRFLVVDVQWSKGDSYCYEVHELTQTGTLDKRRGSHPLRPSNLVSIQYCDEPLPKETQLHAEIVRNDAKQLIDAVLEKGDLSMFLPKSPTSQTPAAQTNSFWQRQ